VIACSDKFWAIPFKGGGGGPVYISSHGNYGKVEPNCPVINGHKGAVTDISFSPFHSHIFATAATDSNINIWKLKNDFEDEDENYLRTLRPEMTFKQHGSSVRTVVHHPSVTGN
jgi:coronin-1B/1C/6